LGIPFTGGEQQKGKETMATTTIPYIDRNVQHVGVSRLRSLNATQLREIDKTLVIQENDQPLAVLLKYEEFLIMQDQLLSVIDTIAALTDNEEMNGLAAGIAEMNAGKTKSISEIRGALKTKKEKG
jgi:PHD/YefM family antitoxin component YafN of YafNO toxin-antitoxin module